jgi:hypothetical protein
MITTWILSKIYFEAMCSVLPTQQPQHNTSSRSPPSSRNSNPGLKDGAPVETCTATPSEGTILLAPGTCAQASAWSGRVYCDATSSNLLAAMMTPDAEITFLTFTHVSTLLLFIDLLWNDHYRFLDMLHRIVAVIVSFIRLGQLILGFWTKWPGKA